MVYIAATATGEGRDARSSIICKMDTTMYYYAFMIYMIIMNSNIFVIPDVITVTKI